eukprot:GHVT01009744.1.p2 GENE.GHVT01009744.1~~GHVT01009744.1.p2  ORF type:complete len:127 (+),score=3.65 GHVT01009744.1:825-1205(+)
MTVMYNEPFALFLIATTRRTGNVPVARNIFGREGLLIAAKGASPSEAALLKLLYSALVLVPLGPDPTAKLTQGYDYFWILSILVPRWLLFMRLRNMPRVDLQVGDPLAREEPANILTSLSVVTRSY